MPASSGPDPTTLPDPSTLPDPTTLFEAARNGDWAALARLLSLVERGGTSSRTVAALAYKSPGDAYTVGITGSPGAGKSTLTDRLITIARRRALGGGPDGGSDGGSDGGGADGGSDGGGADGGSAGTGGGGPVAVLAVDPSSPFSGGAILGDRVRMPSHASDEGVYIRSMATRGHLGGLALAVPDAVRVLSSVGMPVVLVETVGVGQQEVEVATAADTTVVVVNPGWGDAIQANKAGLLEIADLFVINKADRPGAGTTRRDLELMLDLTELGAWRPPIVETVASTGDGVEALWAAIGEHRDHQVARGVLDAHRRQRLEREFHQILVARVEERITEVTRDGRFAEVTAAMLAGDLDPYEAADRLLAMLLSDRNDPGPGA
jgi:LAO/AO transport system kinase